MLSQDYLKSILDYNPDTGILTNKVHRGSKARKDDVVGCLHNSGYLVVVIKGKQYLLHRLIWFYMEGYFPEHQVDHIDRDKTNNKWSNLRHVSMQCNMRNKGLQKNNTSGITGVHFDKKRSRWKSQVKINNKSKTLGYFENLDDAVLVRWNAEKNYGYPNCNTTSTAYNYLLKKGLVTNETYSVA